MNKSRKLTIVSKAFLVLGLFFTAAFCITVKEARAGEEPSLLFSETSKTVGVGETFAVDVIVDTAGEIAHGVGAKISFEPTILEVVSVNPGTIFGDYPVASYDNTSGKIIVSGIAASDANYFKDRGVFATLTFLAKSQGETSVQFIYEPGSTRDSNIAVTYGTGDILTQVSQLSVKVSPGTGGLASAPGTAEFPGQTPERASFFTRLIRFLGLEKEPATIREGRPVSGSIDAYDPIPSQPTITDPNQEQPLSIISSSEDKPLARILKIALVIFLVAILALLGIRFFKSRKKKATIYQNVNISEDDRV